MGLQNQERPDATVTLTAAGVTVLIDAGAGRLPAIVHWGHELPALDAAQAAALVAASEPVVGSNNVELAPRVAVLPEHHTGWSGRPGLRGSFAGRTWSPAFTTRSVALDGVTVSGHQSAGPGAVEILAVDDSDRLQLQLTLELLACGLLRARASVTNLAAEPYTVEEVVPSFPVPAEATEVGPIRPAPTIWCSWYHYFMKVTEQDMLENLDAIEELQLPVDVVQLDDGYQAEIGDWLTLSGRFRSLRDLVARIRDRGRRAGIWTAPFLVGQRSQLYAEHPEWLIQQASAGHNWHQDVFALDVTHPGAAAYLHRVFSTFHQLGIDFFKIDFIYAGALEGRRYEDVPPVEAYRRGVRLIRDAIGPQAYLLGCGAPILPSVGLVDAMRVSPDTAPLYEPRQDDLSQPSVRAAILSGAGRAWQHGRFWVNDPDCLLARPEVEQREDWAAHIQRYGGLRGPSDRLRDLDPWGLQTTRQLLSTVPPPNPFPY